MGAAEPLKSENTAQSASPSASGYFKAGTIERIFDDRGDADGRRLPLMSKALAAFFIGKAQKQRGYSFVLSEAVICETLGIDGKTFRKYLAPLIERGWVVIDKNRPDATRCFHCKNLFEQFGEDRQAVIAPKVARLGKVSRSRRIGKDSQTEDPLRETASSDRESVPLASGNQGVLVRESIPSPNNPSSLTSSPQFLSERWGLKTTKGIERELVFMAEAFGEFGLTERKQRALLQRYGVYALTGAIAYVKDQQRVTKIASPGGLLEWALQHGRNADADVWLGKVSRTELIEADAPQVGKDSLTAEDRVVGDLWASALVWLETRMTAAEFNMLVRPSKPVSFDDGTLRLEVQSAWLRDRVKERCVGRIVEALENLIGPVVRVEVQCADGR